MARDYISGMDDIPGPQPSVDGVIENLLGPVRIGTSANPLTYDPDGGGFIVGYFACEATSGWPAGLYINTNVTGAGGNFTALQGDAIVSAAKENVTGVECFLQFTDGGNVNSGHAAAAQFTVDFDDAALGFGGGAFMAGRFNIKGEGASCDPTGAIRISCIELQTQGTFDTGKDFETMANAYAIYFNGFTPAGGTGSIISSTALAELSTCGAVIGIRVGVGSDGVAGAAYYIPLIPASEWN